MEIVNGMPVVQKGLWAFDIDPVSAVAHFERRIEGQRADLQPLSAGGHWFPPSARGRDIGRDQT